VALARQGGHIVAIASVVTGVRFEDGQRDEDADRGDLGR